MERLNCFQSANVLKFRPALCRTPMKYWKLAKMRARDMPGLLHTMENTVSHLEANSALFFYK